MRKILLTGASGFVGYGVYKHLSEFSMDDLVLALRNPFPGPLQSTLVKLIPTIDGTADWSEIIDGTHVVIHCAARVHVMRDHSTDPLAEFRKVNVEGTLNLARQAVAAGVKRFIFISSVKVNGEGTKLGSSYQADDEPAPVDPYGVSKFEAEQALQALAAQTSMEVVIIRPVLVYGPGVKANFLSMMDWLNKGVPLPFGALYNKRSLVALDNLVDLIVTCIDHPSAANETFLVSDGVDLSTSEMLAKMGMALGKSVRLLPVPSWMLQAGALVLNKRALAQRLCGSLQVDISKTHRLLGWVPPVSVDEAFRRTAKHYLAEQNGMDKK
ncbi:SDR family oxidoreductase [Pseudomonas sp. M30-35]|uniref:UDP-glucose 4-epimerase family protein n=1 Tax=Pseudomonas sp. M30-35 TaxID=1981174 RepID=UPI000B3C533C|nr:SDR family oxidoreductase [Pseudomonas sp. M30-35]ARU88050.1 NAD-dependent dehydratase [Pseudomonas sp. M30-35]